VARQSNYFPWLAIIAAAVLGAATMYMLDPDKGRRRRALARDKLGRAIRDGRHALVGAARDAGHRWQGLRAEVQRGRNREIVPDDLRLIERVRAKLGRVVRHPHAVQVGANRGVVVLSGPILAAEVGELLEAVRGVRGVTAIEDHLAVYESGTGVSGLQDGDATKH
jgi:hypothetical protein